MVLILVSRQCQFEGDSQQPTLTARIVHFNPCTALIGHPIYDLQSLSHKYPSLCSTPIRAPVSPHGFGIPVGAVADHHKNKRLTTAEMVSAANEKNPQHMSLGDVII